MKEFVTAVNDAAEEAEFEAKVKALMTEKNISREEAETEVELGEPIEFMLDGRTMKAYPLSPEQLVFMMASLGRGQTQDARFASIINLILASLRDDDADYFQGRLLDTDRKTRLRLSQVEQISDYLLEEWFGGHPSLPSSDSAPSPQSDGSN